MVKNTLFVTLLILMIVSGVFSQQQILRDEFLIRTNIPLRVYSEPSTESTWTLHRGDRLTVVENRGPFVDDPIRGFNWFKIRAMGTEGWIMGDAVQISPASVERSYRQMANGTGYIQLLLTKSGGAYLYRISINPDIGPFPFTSQSVFAGRWSKIPLGYLLEWGDQPTGISWSGKFLSAGMNDIQKAANHAMAWIIPEKDKVIKIFGITCELLESQ